jgi:hypothetical protein
MKIAAKESRKKECEEFKEFEEFEEFKEFKERSQEPGEGVSAGAGHAMHFRVGQSVVIGNCSPET